MDIDVGYRFILMNIYIYIWIFKNNFLLDSVLFDVKDILGFLSIEKTT